VARSFCSWATSSRACIGSPGQIGKLRGSCATAPAGDGNKARTRASSRNSAVKRTVVVSAEPTAVGRGLMVTRRVLLIRI
jgi:hypothetical protein